MGRLAARDCSLLRHCILQTRSIPSRTRSCLGSARCYLSSKPKSHKNSKTRPGQSAKRRIARAGDEDEAWDNVRLDWHAVPQTRQTLSGRELNFSIKKVSGDQRPDLRWPTHDHTEKQEGGSRKQADNKQQHPRRLRRRSESVQREPNITPETGEAEELEVPGQLPQEGQDGVDDTQTLQPRLRSSQQGSPAWPTLADYNLHEEGLEKLPGGESGLNDTQPLRSRSRSSQQNESKAWSSLANYELPLDAAQQPEKSQGDSTVSRTLTPRKRAVAREATAFGIRGQAQQQSHADMQGSDEPRFPMLFAGRSSLTKMIRAKKREGLDTSFVQTKRDIGLALEKPSAVLAKPSLIISGLSHHVKATDLSRLIEPSLSNWNNQIKTYSRIRDQSTMGSSDKLQVTFHNGEAAQAFMDTLERLQQLSMFKAETAKNNPLWQDLVPDSLRNPNGVEPETELQSYTVAPGSIGPIRVVRENFQRTRTGWVDTLRQALNLPEGHDHPPLVMAELSPSLGKKVDLYSILRSTHKIKHDWNIDAVYAIDQVAQVRDETQMGAYDTCTLGMKRGMERYLVVCPSEDEALAFHRFWNSRLLTAREYGSLGEQDYMLHTSVLDW
ncbi:hypothetical protein LIA77_07595 [Sarocladium implicatum]|nr:hypothetical protein LIA77_07595 [Sarocladium implicatum]